MKIVITGVRGFLGSELARRFLEQGHAVLGISRRRPEGLALTAYLPLSLGQAAPGGAFDGADLVIHAAHDRSPGAQALNVEGTQAWAEQARREGARRQLFLTSVSAHRDAPSEYGRAKAELELYFERIGGLLIRPGLVAGTGGTFGDMARLVRRSPVVPVLGGDRLKVVLTDVDSLFRTVADFQDLKPALPYNLFQPEWIGLLSLTRGLRRHFRRRSLIVPVPLGLSLGLLSLGQKLGMPPTLGPENLKNLEHCQAYGYRSSYAELGLPVKALDEILSNAFPARDQRGGPSRFQSTVKPKASPKTQA